ncbi:SRPBCC family protein [Synechococcus sp. CS-1324]|nr:SRPBCC family protein [Synechococcus sp. CS-1324]PZV02468.1 MAG: oligoketide cyclase [Cyanobium sp.]
MPSPNLVIHHLAHPSGLDIAPGPGPGLGLQVCALDTIQQDMERLPQGVRRLAVQLRLGLSQDLIWTVITDYENLSGFIPNLASSKLLWRQGNQVGLEQVGCQQFCGLRFSARVELVLVEQRDDGVLRFRMTQGDFRRFEGAWTVSRDPQGARLLYELTVQGRPGMPIGLIEQRLREDLAANLRAVQQEAMQRFQAS